MENSSKQILCIVTVDKRMTEMKSTNLEKACFLKCLKFLLDKDLKIAEGVTDAHVQIASIMSRSRQEVQRIAGMDKRCGESFLGMWIDVLHHVGDEHEWIFAYSTNNKRKHGPLSSESDKGWLSTAELENFQNLIMMYASKRHSYRPPTYRCRNLLAALDHNGHIGRSILTKMDQLADEIGMNQRMILEVDDPRRVSAHLAPVPSPPT
ncbi:unnamed protein product [Mytilus coruscus]|uniref:Uncharacterized protein n=1 Tax=Mytilus coruscus TaxID=42192 RepID=A0A6J8F377_MYTCO|nr:unnamed protein product [Mytilus coruscus]